MKNRFIISILFIFLASNITFSQTIEWQKCHGGSDSEFSEDFFLTTDSGFLNFGVTHSQDGEVTGNHGEYDIWLIRMDSAGELQWQKTYGNEGLESVVKVIQTTDNGYALCGYTTIPGNIYADYLVMKLDSSGEMQWQKTFGGSSNDVALGIAQTQDGGYIVCGYSNSNDGSVTNNHGADDYWLIRLDSAGNLKWQKSFGGTGDDRAMSLLSLEDGGYIISGFSSSNNGDVTGNHGYFDYWILRLDSVGTMQWQKTYGGTQGESDNSALLQTADEGFLIFGRTYSTNGDITNNHGDCDAWLIKIDKNGVLEWEKTYGGSNFDVGRNICKAKDGGYLLTARTMSEDGDVTVAHGGADAWILATDSSGNLQWQQTYGGVDFDAAGYIQELPLGKYVFSGTTTSNDGDVTGNQGKDDFWVVKLRKNDYSVAEHENPGDFWTVFPVPVHDYFFLRNSEETSTTFSYKILNIAGMLIKSGISDTKVQIPIEELNSGFYLIQLRTAKGTSLSKVLIKE